MATTTPTAAEVEANECIQVYHYRCLHCGVRGENIESLMTLDLCVDQHHASFPSHRVRVSADIEAKDVEIEIRTGERRP